jgi:hypothetical protein
MFRPQWLIWTRRSKHWSPTSKNSANSIVWNWKAHPPAARASGAGLGQFAIKTAIVAGVIAAVIVVSGGYLAGSINNSIQENVSNVRSLKIGGAKFWSRVEETVDRMAAPGSDMPEAKKQKLLGDIRAIGAKWRPFLVEIHAALDVPNSPTAKAPARDTPEAK